eukprot:scaffold34882_cov52-Attheya_sp.AAC.1
MVCLVLSCGAMVLDAPLGRRAALDRGLLSGVGVVLLNNNPAAAESTYASSLSARCLSDAENVSLTIPTNTIQTSSGVDNFYFPAWMEGEWDVTQTLVNVATPLGLKFIGGPAASLEVAQASLVETKKQLNIPVNLKLRWIGTKFGMAEDLLFNTRQRLDSFAGRSVVASVDYSDVRASNRAAIMAGGGSELDPLATTVVRFKGPAAQKTFLLAHGTEPDRSDPNHKWAGFELLRSIFALTNTNTVPPVTTDTESIWYLENKGDGVVEAKLRLASYLNAQSDSLYFESKNKAVFISDYTLRMTQR